MDKCGCSDVEAGRLQWVMEQLEGWEPGALSMEVDVAQNREDTQWRERLWDGRD